MAYVPFPLGILVLSDSPELPALNDNASIPTVVLLPTQGALILMTAAQHDPSAIVRAAAVTGLADLGTTHLTLLLVALADSAEEVRLGHTVPLLQAMPMPYDHTPLPWAIDVSTFSS